MTVGEFIEQLQKYPKDMRIIHVDTNRYEGNDPTLETWKIPTMKLAQYPNMVPNDGKWFEVRGSDSTFQYIPKDAPEILGIS